MLKHHLIAILTLVFVVSGCVVDDGPALNVRERKADPLVWPQPPERPRFHYEKVIMSSLDADPSLLTSIGSQFGGSTKGLQGMGKPYGVAVHRGRVFVGDTAYKEIFAFDLVGKKFFRFGNEKNTPGELQQPIGLDADDAGNLYVSDNQLKVVKVYDRDGKFLRIIGGPGYFEKPIGIGVEPNGERLYVVDLGGIRSAQHRVAVFNAKTGEHLFNFGSRGPGPGQFNLPRDVTVAPDGTLYVVDGANFRVQHFTREGKFLNAFGKLGRMMGMFSRPKEIAADASGNVYVIDSAFGNFQIFNPKGQLLMSVGGRGERNAPGKYLLPAGIDIDEDGRIYVVDQMHRRVDIYRPHDLSTADGYMGTDSLSGGIPWVPKEMDKSKTEESEAK